MTDYSADDIFKPDAFPNRLPASDLEEWGTVGAFKLEAMIDALEDFEELVASDIAVFASCPTRVSIGLMLQLQLQINKMVQFSEQISGLLANLNSIISTTISNASRTS